MKNKLNIVIPMAGRGSRFSEAGYKEPKFLIPILDKTMIEVVVSNLTPKREHKFIFVCQKEHIEKYDLKNKLSKLAENIEIIGICGITEGQVCTVLNAVDFINNEEALMTANCDQYIDFNIDDYLDYMDDKKYDGLIMTMTSKDEKWSYAKIDANGIVTETAEKKVISNEATVGIYNFRHGKYLVNAANKMILDNIRVNGEFYTCPVYNYLIQDGYKIGIYNIGEEYNGMFGLGIPKDLELFLKHPISEKVK